MHHLLNTKKWYKKFKETGDSGYICQNKLDKSYFQHDMASGDFKYLPRRTTSDKVLHDKALKMLQIWWMSVVYKFLDKSSGGAIENKFMSNQELTEELHKSVIRKFEKQKVYSYSKGLSNKSMKYPAAPNNGLALALTYINTAIKFGGSSLKQEKVTFNH